jgi:hypothetical protein
MYQHTGIMCAGTSVNNNNNKKRSKNNKSPKLCLGDLIIVICHNIINQGTQTFDQLFLSTVGLIYPRGHDLGNFMFIFSNVLYDRAICYFLYYKNRLHI